MITRRKAPGVNVRSISVATMLPGVLVLLALVFALASANAQTVDKDRIVYLTGGVGSDEMERLWPSNPETDFPGPKATERE